MADVNYMMKGIQRAFERQKKQALVAEKQPPVAAKAPVVAPKQEPKKEELNRPWFRRHLQAS